MQSLRALRMTCCNSYIKNTKNLFKGPLTLGREQQLQQQHLPKRQQLQHQKQPHLIILTEVGMVVVMVLLRPVMLITVQILPAAMAQ